MKYKKFNETRAETIILDEFVELVWNAYNINRYVPMGYEYTGYMDKFMCQIRDLPPTSTAVVFVMCPSCEECRFSRYGNITKAGSTLCPGCSRIIDLVGIKFGMLTVLDFVGLGKRKALWKCVCDCGNEKIVPSNDLVEGHTKSCGCYSYEFINKENHYCWKGGPVTLVCEQCGEEYSKKRSRAEQSRFCSLRCYSQWQSENIVGEAHHNWDSSITEEERFIGRKYPEYKQWIQAILERDQYTCQICGTTEDIEVHHLYDYSSYPEYAVLDQNGLTICKKDHADFHVWLGGYGVPCVPSDIDRWLYETCK